jgi:hypothetical protein
MERLNKYLKMVGVFQRQAYFLLQRTLPFTVLAIAKKHTTQSSL